MLKSYLKQDNIAPHFILFELDFNVKFPLLRLLIFLSDLKSTIPLINLYPGNIWKSRVLNFLFDYNF